MSETWISALGLSLAPCRWGGGKVTGTGPSCPVQLRGTRRPQPALGLLLQQKGFSWPNTQEKLFVPTLTFPAWPAAPIPGQAPVGICLASLQVAALTSLSADCSPELEQAVLAMNLATAVPLLKKGTYF